MTINIMTRNSNLLGAAISKLGTDHVRALRRWCREVGLDCYIVTI